VIIYQLHASGPLKYLEGINKIVSRKAFVDKGAAEEYKPEFIKACTESPGDPKSLGDIDPKTIQVHIVELELIHTEPELVEKREFRKL